MLTIEKMHDQIFISQFGTGEKLLKDLEQFSWTVRIPTSYFSILFMNRYVHE